MSNQSSSKSKLLLVAGLGFAISAAASFAVFKRGEGDPDPISDKSTEHNHSHRRGPPSSKSVEEAPSPPRGTCSKVMDRAALDKSLELGTKFLLAHQKEAGNFDYEYDWVAQTYTDGDNQVRQAGAFWGLALIYQDHPTPEVKAALDRAISFFRTHSKVGNDQRRYIVYPGDREGSLGTVALVALAYLDFLRAESGGWSAEERAVLEKERDEYLEFLHSTRRSDGLFHSKYDFNAGIPSGKASPYSDGETLLAFVKAAKYAGYKKYEKTAREAADAGYKLNVVAALEKDRDSNTTKGFYQWSSMAYFELATSGWSDVEKYGDWLIELADWMIDVHRTLTRERNTGYAYEGIIPSYELSKQRGLDTKARKYGCVIESGLEKLTSWQVGHPLAGAAIADRKTEDPKAIGGVQNHAVEPKLRVDVTQHQMHAVILARRYYWPAGNSP
jgi:UDP-N-acetylmuramoyl-tripeptide--D-alanyl-D-alanine ligase